MPDAVRKLTKKYLTKDFVTINLAKEKTEETATNDEVTFSYKSFIQFIYIFFFLLGFA